MSDVTENKVTETTAATDTEKAAQTQSAKDILREASAGLLMMSESDRPFVAFTWPAKKTGDAATAEDALRAAIQPAPKKVKSADAGSVLRPDDRAPGLVAR